MKKICIILGTRPEIIKMSPLIRLCKKNKLDFFVLHTGQHYSYNMDKKFFEDLELEQPKYNLGINGNEYRKEVGLMIPSIMAVLEKEKPGIVLVLGDTNSVLSGALAANKLGIKVGHVEAGLRSHNLDMLEEITRIIVDHISDLLFAPTSDAFNKLQDEKIEAHKLFLTGNTIVESVQQNLQVAEKKVNIFNRLKIKKGEYVLVTAHRAENVDNYAELKGILDGLSLVSEDLKIPMIYPMHPRTKKNLDKFGLTVPQTITVIEPLGYLEFLQLESGAKIVLTDSGGLQEEACILRVPCVTMRNETERPETIEVGVNILAGTNPDKILNSVREMLSRDKNWINPFGEGNTSEQIINISQTVL